MAVVKLLESGTWVSRPVWKTQTSGVFDRGVGKVLVGGEWVPFTQLIIDDFESGTTDAYKDGGSGTHAVNATAAMEGSYGLELRDGFEILWSFPSFPTPLRNYPEMGDDFEFLINPRNTGGGEQYWFSFCRQNDQETVSQAYNIEFISGSGETFRIRKVDAGTADTLAGDFDIPAYSPQPYRCRMETTEAGDMTGHLFNENGTEISTISGSDSEWSSGGISWRNSGGGHVYYDDARIIP